MQLVTTKYQTSYPDVRHSSTYNTQSKRTQLLIHIIPPVPGADGCSLVIGGYSDLVEVDEVNCDTSLYIGCTGEGCMPSTLHCEWTLKGAKDVDCLGNFG